ncbi:MAG: hypothetical protein ACYDEF_09390 [Methanosarcina sp.]
MILKLNTNELVVFDSLSEAGLSDYAIIAEMFALFGLEIRVVPPKVAEVPVYEEGCDAV